MTDTVAHDAARSGAKALEQWRLDHPEQRLDLTGADLRRVVLRWVNFAGAVLDHANLTDADLTGAYFGPATINPREPLVRASNQPASLRGTTFIHTDLLAATFNYTDLEGADFGNAWLGLAQFRRCNLRNARMAGATLMNTAFLNQDLSGVIGLDDTQHRAPSFVDVLSFQRMGTNRLPAAFVQGIGLSQDALGALTEPAQQAIIASHQSLFVSHAHVDKQFCEHLCARLREAGLQVWYAPHDMQGGRKVFHQIDEAIQAHDRVLLVLSGASINSPWVASEVRLSRDRERQVGRQVLFPISVVPFEDLKQWILVDGESGEDYARTVREYYIPDFSEWRDRNQFERQVTRLLASLASPHATGAELRRKDEY